MCCGCFGKAFICVNARSRQLGGLAPFFFMCIILYRMTPPRWRVLDGLRESWASEQSEHVNTLAQCLSWLSGISSRSPVFAGGRQLQQYTWHGDGMACAYHNASQRNPVQRLARLSETRYSPQVCQQRACLCSELPLAQHRASVLLGIGKGLDAVSLDSAKIVGHL